MRESGYRNPIIHTQPHTNQYADCYSDTYEHAGASDGDTQSNTLQYPSSDLDAIADTDRDSNTHQHAGASDRDAKLRPSQYPVSDEHADAGSTGCPLQSHGNGRVHHRARSLLDRRRSLRGHV
jgi:hypothetical protein